jgi:hypothetical protein
MKSFLSPMTKNSQQASVKQSLSGNSLLKRVFAIAFGMTNVAMGMNVLTLPAKAVVAPATCGNLVTGEGDGTFGVMAPGVNTRDLEAPPTSTGSGAAYAYGGTAVGSLLPEARYVVTSKTWSPELHNSPASNGHHWHGLVGHTTGLDNDAYLAINGATSVGIFYKQNFQLVANQDYQLSLWAMNAALLGTNATQSPPNLGIRMIRTSDNVKVADTNTGNLAQTFKSFTTSNWQQALVKFNAGSGGTFRLEVYNVSKAAVGNDYAIDDVSVVPVSTTGTCPTSTATPNTPKLQY